MNTIRKGAGLGLAAALIVGVLGGASASAQIYPQPEGYCIISLSDPLPPLDSEITLTVTAADRAGTPLEGVEGLLQITEQPGNTASLDPAVFTTGADGTAEVTLRTGDEPGLIRVSSPCGPVEVSANIPVGGPPGPPQTGTGLSEGGSAAGGMADMAAPAGVLAALATLGVAGGVLRRRARA